MGYTYLAQMNVLVRFDLKGVAIDQDHFTVLPNHDIPLINVTQDMPVVVQSRKRRSGVARREQQEIPACLRVVLFAVRGAVQHMDWRPASDFWHQEPNNRTSSPCVQRLLWPCCVTYQLIIDATGHKQDFLLLFFVRHLVINLSYLLGVRRNFINGAFAPFSQFSPQLDGIASTGIKYLVQA